MNDNGYADRQQRIDDIAETFLDSLNSGKFLHDKALVAAADPDIRDALRQRLKFIVLMWKSMPKLGEEVVT